MASHVSFRNPNRGKIGFKVERYQDGLYVVKSADGACLDVGDKIIQVDGLPVSEFGERHKEFLYGETESRQGDYWSNLLSYAREVTVVKKNTDNPVTCPIVLRREWDSEPLYLCKKLNEDTAYLRLKDFSDEEQIQKLYVEHDALLRSSEYLIIDVRDNGGGTDTAFLPLLEFCLPEGWGIQDLEDGIYDGGNEINYSVRNCQSRLKDLAEFRQMELPEETLKILEEMERELAEKQGKGFVTEESADLELPITGAALPRKVYILPDSGCASSGDNFVDVMRKSPKVTVVGRPTMGILDYSNCTFRSYGEYMFMYPTSRALYLDRGVQMRNHGVPVDVYVEWTPEHLTRDVDLETVLALIGREREA